MHKVSSVILLWVLQGLPGGANMRWHVAQDLSVANLYDSTKRSESD